MASGERCVCVYDPWIKVTYACPQIAQVAMGLKVGREVFADRGFNSDGTLVPRSQSGAVIQDIDEVVDRSLRMIIENKVVSVNGDVIDIEADSLCLHGDTPGAVDMARKLKSELISNQVMLVNLSESLQA